MNLELLPAYYDEPETCEICGDQNQELFWNEYDALICAYCREQATFVEIPVDEIEEMEVSNDAA